MSDWVQLKLFFYYCFLTRHHIGDMDYYRILIIIGLLFLIDYYIIGGRDGLSNGRNAMATGGYCRLE